MLNAISHSAVFVLDQDQALDFYVGKLGMEVSADVDMGFMRWLTVNVPGDDRHVLLERPGPPGMDDAAAEQIRELVTKGSTGLALHPDHRRLPEDLRGAQGQGRRVQRGAHRALLRHRLRLPRPLRQQHPPHPAGARPDRVPGLIPNRLGRAATTGGAARSGRVAAPDSAVEGARTVDPLRRNPQAADDFFKEVWAVAPISAPVAPESAAATEPACLVSRSLNDAGPECAEELRALGSLTAPVRRSA